jgi:hypothetical protein
MDSPVEGPMEPLKLPESWESWESWEREQDESTEAPLLHLKSLYCFALLQITSCSAGPPRSDLRWLLYSIRTAWLDTYLAPVWPSSSPRIIKRWPCREPCLSTGSA